MSWCTSTRYIIFFLLRRNDANSNQASGRMRSGSTFELGITTIELVDMNPPIARSGYMSPLLAAKFSMKEEFDFQNPKNTSKRIKEFVDDCLVMSARERLDAYALSKREFFKAIITPQEFLHRVWHV